MLMLLTIYHKFNLVGMRNDNWGIHMEFDLKHVKRDRELPAKREELLQNALADLTADINVLAIYLAGSLGRGDFDLYSDIDLHIVVMEGTKKDFILDKKNRAAKWGNVLFYEGISASPVIVTHYDNFIKVDSWYHTLEEIEPSIWLKGIKPLYDPSGILNPIIEEVSNKQLGLEEADIIYWKTKVLAFMHETYRSTMRNEIYYALSNLDRVRWLIADGWYMEMEKHLDSSYGVWSKIEGSRSQLTEEQLEMLASWDCNRDATKIFETMNNMYSELLRLNNSLCQKVNIDAENEKFKTILKMVL